MAYEWHSGFAIFALSVVVSTSARAEPRPVVLELYTSEGCSSCPPAETLVHELAQRNDVLPLSFHVDYWDNLGWRDRYSLASATERQRRYAHVLKKSSVYTPQAVIDGSIDVVGSDRAAVTRAVSVRSDGVATSVSVTNGVILITVGTGGEVAPAEVVLVGYLREATTHIGRGENAGRTLVESNIVRSLQVLGHWNGPARDYRVKLTSLPDDVSDIAVLIQSSAQGLIVGAVSQSIR